MKSVDKEKPKMKKIFMQFMLLSTLVFLSYLSGTAYAQQEEKVITFQPFVWKSEPPEGCPFDQSTDITGIRFNGKCSNYHVADTWYPSWASDGNLYSPWTDGETMGLRSWSSGFTNDGKPDSQGNVQFRATTSQAMVIGDDPIRLEIKNVGGLIQADPYPYGGRYPCGSLVYNGVWYYGTYTLAPYGITRWGDGMDYNWPWLGPFVGFRISTDFGKSWIETPHTPSEPLFGENGMGGYPAKIGSPHFVDFGKNMEHSPDGKAYLITHGAEPDDPEPRFANLSWITGDQIYLIRVSPGIGNMNDASQYEFFYGHNSTGNPLWTNDFNKIEPLIDWNNNCGCVTMTYNAPLKKYLMCITDGWPTAGKMNTFILESDLITGPWKLIVYMKEFGEQGYFVNFPSKFISADGRTAWLCYSGNYAKDWNGMQIRENPPGSHYGLVLQEVTLLGK